MTMSSVLHDVVALLVHYSRIRRSNGFFWKAWKLLSKTDSKAMVRNNREMVVNNVKCRNISYHKTFSPWTSVNSALGQAK